MLINLYRNLIIFYKFLLSYGNSDVENDIAKILGWEIKDDELTDHQINIANKLHKETETALQICLSRLKFETGVYENYGHGIEWVKVS